MTKRKQQSEARPVGDLLAPALRALGMPSKRVTQRIQQAWDRAAAPSWMDVTRPVKLVGGVLFVEVDSAALRQELAQFHAERLLTVLKAAVSDIPLIGIRFVAGSAESGSGDKRGDR